MTEEMRTDVPATAKRLDEMNRLGDMAHFPVAVNAGATANVLLTLAVTWWVEPRFPREPGDVGAALLWTALVLAVNLLPVVLLRRTMRPGEPDRRLGEMDFVRDQHRFSDWVYLAASANMAFWVLTGWAVFAVVHTGRSLGGMLLLAFLATFSPVLLRRRVGESKRGGRG